MANVRTKTKKHGSSDTLSGQVQKTTPKEKPSGLMLGWRWVKSDLESSCYRLA
jgi:hypothetical protein